MKSLLLATGLLLALPGLAQRPAPTKKVMPAPRPPVSAYTKWLLLSEEVADLLRRAMAEPDDAKALAVLESPETMRLLERGQDLRPDFRTWRNRLSDTQRETIFQDFLRESTVMRYLDSLDHDPVAKARLKHNPNLASTIEGVVYQVLMD